MAYQPRGIFVGNTLAWLQARLQAQYARLDGQVMSFGEASQSVSQSAGMAPDEQIIELNYAIGNLTGELPARQSRPNFGGVANAGGCYGA